MKKLLSLIFVGFLVACSTLPSKWQMQDNRSAVKLLNVPGMGNGSGVVIAPGVILTARHVTAIIDGPVETEMFAEPGHVKVTFLRKSEKHDLGLVSAPGIGCPCASLAEVLPEVDDEVVTIGYPFNQFVGVQMLTTGRYHGVVEDKIIVSAPAARGNSGGGVFSQEGLIGILVEGLGDAGHLTRSVSLEAIKEFLGEHGA